MALVTSNEMILNAQKGGYAIPAFNVENMEMAMAVIQAAEEMRSPVILQTTPSTVKYAGTAMYAAMVYTLARTAAIPIAIHLDHGESFALAAQAIRDGYTSIMIDGSHQSFEDNITLTCKVVEMAHACGIPVEAELGKVGGKEDDLDGGESDNNTNPAQAAEFVERTGADFLAVAIGTAHGVYTKTPKIDIDLLRKIRATVDIPLVLHGTTGVDSQIVRQCIEAGMCKVNYATELRIAYSDGIKEALIENPEVFDPKTYGRAGMAKVKEVATKNILLCMSNGKAQAQV